MAHDFREVKQVVMDTVRDMDKKDPNWKWKAVVQKTQVKIFWGYLEYLECKEPHFIITDGSPEKEECNSEDDDFIVLRDEDGHYMNGAILGDKSWQDGDLEKAVVMLMRGLQSRVNRTY